MSAEAAPAIETPKTKGKKSKRHGNERSRNKKSTERSTNRRQTQTMTTVSVEEETTGFTAGDSAIIELASKSLGASTWYHGLMPREECEGQLKNDGDFLVRRTTMKNQKKYCITVMQGTPRHFPLDTKKGGWSIYQNSADTLPELIEHLHKNAIPIGSGNPAILKNPISRPDYYLLHENIKMDKKLGSGAFGEVFIGKLSHHNEEVAVAVKTIKGQVGKKKLVEFVKEAKLMRRFCHQNCVRLMGVAPQEVPLMIVLELCPNGCLKSWFKKRSDKDNQAKDQLEMMSFMQDAARGMCYLSLSNVIHRDLAARNCLLGKDNMLKISDFGLSVADKQELVLDKLKNVPVKWLAPETLTRGKFSTKTDVWSFGIVVWEIYSKCKTDPFPGMNNAQAKEIILADGPPMIAPQDSPPIVQEVMSACFTKHPTNRPDFVSVLKMVSPEEAPPSGERAPE